MNNLSDIEKELIAVIQSDFPVAERPFKKIARRIGHTESEVIAAIAALIDDGTIRAFSPVFEARMLGYVSTLSAAEVANDSVGDLAEVMNDIGEITHNYLRDYELNMWFTLSARNDIILQNILSRIGQFTGVSRILSLPAIKVYKINAVFGAAETRQPEKKKNAEYRPLSEEEIRLVRCLQDGFPIVEQPFKVIAERIDTEETVIIDTVRDWIEAGIIRRFGARLNHRRAGFTANTLAVWKSGNYDALGETFARLPSVSHCYRRPSHSDWPYELYTMVHARSEEKLDNLLNDMKSSAPGAEMITLKTVRELKKTTMKYFLEDGQWDSPLQE